MFVRVVLVVLGVLSAHAALAQPPKAAYVAPRTGWGAPELNGLWTNTTMTPLQRPAQYKGQREANGTFTAEVTAPREEGLHSLEVRLKTGSETHVDGVMFFVKHQDEPDEQRKQQRPRDKPSPTPTPQPTPPTYKREEE